METDNKNDLDIKSQSQPNSEEAGGGGEDNITLQVQDQGGDTVSFKIKKKTNLRKLMTAYCNKKGLDLKAVRFRYEIYLNNQNDLPTHYYTLLSP